MNIQRNKFIEMKMILQIKRSLGFGHRFGKVGSGIFSRSEFEFDFKLNKKCGVVDKLWNGSPDSLACVTDCEL